MKATCMYATPNPRISNDEPQWIRCGWMGDVADLTTSICPQCHHAGHLAPRVDIPSIGANPS